MAVLVIPVKSEVPAHEFPIELERVVYTLRFRFNYRMERWILDVLTRDSVAIVTGVPLLTGVDLLGRYNSTELPPGNFMVYDTTKNMNSPGFSDLGKTVQLLYFESAAV